MINNDEFQKELSRVASKLPLPVLDAVAKIWQVLNQYQPNLLPPLVTVTDFKAISLFWQVGEEIFIVEVIKDGLLEWSYSDSQTRWFYMSLWDALPPQQVIDAIARFALPAT